MTFFLSDSRTMPVDLYVQVSTAWTAQAATDWGQTFASSVDYKHADCNGDGIVDANDNKR